MSENVEQTAVFLLFIVIRHININFRLGSVYCQVFSLVQSFILQFHETSSPSQVELCDPDIW